METSLWKLSAGFGPSFLETGCGWLAPKDAPTIYYPEPLALRAARRRIFARFAFIGYTYSVRDGAIEIELPDAGSVTDTVSISKATYRKFI